MESWYHDNLDGNERILLSDSGYSNDDLALKWLQHFILHTRSSSNSEPKVLLLDSHASHRTPEFTILATEHCIHPYAFPSHLTHVLQPLDVGIFHPYKHWHKAAVHRVIRSLDFEYNTSSFIRDLPEIRSNTFREQTIYPRISELWYLAGRYEYSYSEASEVLKAYATTSDSNYNPTDI